MRRRMQPIILTLATLLTACGGHERQPRYGGEPFDSAPIRELAARHSADPTRVAGLYREMLARFGEIYGDGIGPARSTPAYHACRQTFNTVATIDGRAVSDHWLTEQWAQLRACRTAASSWSQGAEIATFGDDLDAVATAALAVLACAATQSRSSRAPALYAEANAG